MSALEEHARIRWEAWGHAWAMWTQCRYCHEFRYCRAKRRGFWRCLDCFDQL